MAAGHSNEASTRAKTPPTFRGPQNIRGRSAVPANGRRNGRILMKFAPFRGRRIDPNSNSVQMPIPKRTPISHAVAASSSRAEEARQFWAEIEASSPEDGLAQLRFWVGRVAMRLVNDRRGCEFTNAAVELTEEDHPARKFVGDIKTEYRDWLAKLCRKAGIARAELLADTLSILLEGVRTSRQSVGPEGPSSQFQAIAEAIIESFRR